MATPFSVGDWADHKSGGLDPRRVTRVEGDRIWIDILGSERGPYRAADYDNTRDYTAYRGEAAMDSVDVSRLCLLVAELERKLEKSQSSSPKVLINRYEVEALARVASQLDANTLAAARKARES